MKEDEGYILPIPFHHFLPIFCCDMSRQKYLLSTWAKRRQNKTLANQQKS